MYRYLMLLTLPALATAAPLELTHSSRLVDASGAGINGTHSMAFALYESEAAETPLWSSSPMDVTLAGGYFSTVLGADGSLQTDDLPDAGAWLQITLDDAPFGERQQLRSVPYAVSAQTVAVHSVDSSGLAQDPDSLAQVSGGTLQVNPGDATGDFVVVNDWLYADQITSSNGYREFVTDAVSAPTNSSQTYTLLDMYCSGHWGSYYVEIELVTAYFKPAVTRYEYYCGYDAYTNGGNLVQVSTSQASGAQASLSKTNLGATGYQNSGINIYHAQLRVSQPAYVRSYARVRHYGSWPSLPAGSTVANTGVGGVWQTWTP